MSSLFVNLLTAASDTTDSGYKDWMDLLTSEEFAKFFWTISITVLGIMFIVYALKKTGNLDDILGLDSYKDEHYPKEFEEMQARIIWNEAQRIAQETKEDVYEDMKKEILSDFPHRKKKNSFKDLKAPTKDELRQMRKKRSTIERKAKKKRR